MRHLAWWLMAGVLVVGGTGCSSYVTPGGPVRLDDISHVDAAVESARLPAPHFPARVAVVRVQAPHYQSFSSASVGTGNFSVVMSQQLMGDEQLHRLEQWPSVEAVTRLDPLLLPPKLDSLEDLRLVAAKLQADILLVYTIDTRFELQGKAYGPLSSISLGVVPDADACISATASAAFTDVRTGFTYASAQASAQAKGLAQAWGSSAVVDGKRQEAEHQAFGQLLAATEQTWSGIARQYQ